MPPETFDIIKQLTPCLHCGKQPTEKEIYHQDYIGDSYVGDEYSLLCECGIEVDFTTKELLIEIWNRKPNA